MILIRWLVCNFFSVYNCVCMYVCLLTTDLQINNVSPVLELKDQLVDKKLSDQILK